MFEKVKSIFTSLVGDHRQFTLEDRLFNTISLLNGVANLVGVVAIVQLQNYRFLLNLQVTTGIVFLVFYCLSRFRGLARLLYWPFVLVIVVFIFLNSIVNGGLMGGAHYYIFPALVIALILSRSVVNTILAFFLFFALAAGLAATAVFKPEWITNHVNPMEQFMDVTGNLMFVGFFIGAVVLVLAKNMNLEREKSERLLINILPLAIANELKMHNRIEPKEFDATILFTDFVGFTKAAEQMTPHELIGNLDRYFSLFDQICKKYNLEKIKTIGDSYMAVAGLPISNSTHAVDAVNAAIEMRDVILSEGEKNSWKIRIGLNTGSVVAGVIGQQKFSYDVWGDAVNLASRLESSGVENAVNISQNTYERVKSQFVFENRGFVAVKNKSDTLMYLVKNRVNLGEVHNG